MAVVLRAMQWNLDDAAFRVGRGELGDVGCDQLAARLESTAASVRAYMQPDQPDQLIIDADYSRQGPRSAETRGERSG